MKQSRTSDHGGSECLLLQMSDKDHSQALLSQMLDEDCSECLLSQTSDEENPQLHQSQDHAKPAQGTLTDQTNVMPTVRKGQLKKCDSDDDSEWEYESGGEWEGKRREYSTIDLHYYGNGKMIRGKSRLADVCIYQL